MFVQQNTKSAPGEGTFMVLGALQGRVHPTEAEEFVPGVKVDEVASFNYLYVKACSSNGYTIQEACTATHVTCIFALMSPH